MMEGELSPFHQLSSGLCGDAAGEAFALVRRMGGGDAAALSELYGMWAPVLLGCAWRMLGDRREADEVLQKTFEQLWKSAADYTPHQVPPFVWAFVTLRGLAMEKLARRRPGKRETPRHPPGVPGGRADVPKALSGDDCRRLNAAMDLLDLEERTCLEHAVFLGYARTAGADPSNPPGASVKSRLRRALETVRNHLSRHEL